MPIRACAVIAIEGTHASGKTTLLHALTAHYRQLGVNVTAMGEPARSSPFMEDVVLHKLGDFDIVAEVDVFAAHLRAQLRAARNHQLLIADKTIINVVAYAMMLLDRSNDLHTADVLNAMVGFCRAWSHTYDVVLYTQDRYQQPSDGFRAKVADLQEPADAILRRLYGSLNVPLIEVPLGLDTTERVSWATKQVAELGLELPR